MFMGSIWMVLIIISSWIICKTRPSKSWIIKVLSFCLQWLKIIMWTIRITLCIWYLVF